MTVDDLDLPGASSNNMPNEQEIMISKAEAHGSEISEQLIAKELFPSLDVEQRSLLVAWKLRPDYDDVAKDGTQSLVLGEKMRAAGLFKKLTQQEKAILQMRYGLSIPPGWE